MTSKQIPADLSARMSASIVLSRREMKSTRKSERGKGRRPAESREQTAERQGGECTVTGAGLIRCTLRQQNRLHCTAGRQQATENGRCGHITGKTSWGVSHSHSRPTRRVQCQRVYGRGDAKGATEIRATDELGRWIGWS